MAVLCDVLAMVMKASDLLLINVDTSLDHHASSLPLACVRGQKLGSLSEMLIDMLMVALVQGSADMQKQ